MLGVSTAAMAGLLEVIVTTTPPVGAGPESTTWLPNTYVKPAIEVPQFSVMEAGPVSPIASTCPLVELASGSPRIEVLMWLVIVVPLLDAVVMGLGLLASTYISGKGREI